MPPADTPETWVRALRHAAQEEEFAAAAAHADEIQIQRGAKAQLGLPRQWMVGEHDQNQNQLVDGVAHFAGVHPT